MGLCGVGDRNSGIYLELGPNNSVHTASNCGIKIPFIITDIFSNISNLHLRIVFLCIAFSKEADEDLGRFGFGNDVHGHLSYNIFLSEIQAKTRR
jgi:hypothetical protein